MDYRPRNSVEGPHQYQIDLAAAGVGHQLVKARPLCFHAGDFVCIFLHDLETALCGHLTQVEQLAFRMLIDTRHPGVKNGTFHLCRLFGFGEYLAM